MRIKFLEAKNCLVNKHDELAKTRTYVSRNYVLIAANLTLCSIKSHRPNVYLRVGKKKQLDVTFCIVYFSSNSCSTCFGQPCAHHQELTTA